MKRNFKEDLKQEFSQKVPNILDKIEIERVVIKEAPQEKAPFRFKLRYSVLSVLSVLMIFLVVAVAVTGNKERIRKANLEESKAVMASAIAASQASHITASNAIEPVIMVSNDEKEETEEEFNDQKWLNEDIFSDIEKYIPILETNLLSEELIVLEDENWDISLKLIYKDLNEVEKEIYIYYNEKETDQEKKISGKLVIDNKELEISGVIKKDGTILLDSNNIQIVSKLENKKRKFEVTTTGFNFKFKSYQESGKKIIELETGRLLSVTYRFTSEETPRGYLIASELEYKDRLLGLSLVGKVEIEATETMYHFTYSGKITILDQVSNNYSYSVSRPKLD